MEPSELADMVQSIRQVELALGTGVKIPSGSEIKNIAVARKSLVANCDIKAGENFTMQNITTKRPGDGISAIHYWDFIGKKAVRDYYEDELIRE